MATKSFGNITVTNVVELTGPMFDAASLLPDWTDEGVAGEADWLVPRHYEPATKLLVMPIQSFLIKTPHHTILLDGCFGNGKVRERPSPRFSHLDEPWLERLADAGAAPEDVDIVMCTHLHPDHVGWNTRLEDGRWVPTFPNAKYLFDRTELAFWNEMVETGERPTPHMVDSVLPVIAAGQSVVVETGHEIEDGVVLEPLPGHTPGHSGIHLSSNGDEAVLTGDMIHHPIQITFPDWSSVVDVDPGQSRQVRRKFLETYADTATVIAPAHFPDPVFGFIRGGGNGFRWQYDE